MVIFLILPKKPYVQKGQDEIVFVEETVGSQSGITLSSSKGGNGQTNSMKVSLLSDDVYWAGSSDNESNQEKINLEALRDEQIQMLLDENGLTMYDFVNSKDQIADAVLLQVEKILKEYDEKIKEVEANQGKNGTDGKTGKDGLDGKDGKDGIAGAAGKPGTAGISGKDGKDGENGKDGSNGKSVYVRYSEYSNGANMTAAPTDSTQYIGTYEGESASSDPSRYQWSKYVGMDGKNSYIRYSESATGLNMTIEPNEKTRYFGTYLGTQASDNPNDYTWTQYKDMVSYYTEDDNTLHFVIP